MRRRPLSDVVWRARTRTCATTNDDAARTRGRHRRRAPGRRRRACSNSRTVGHSPKGLLPARSTMTNTRIPTRHTPIYARVRVTKKTPSRDTRARTHSAHRARTTGVCVWVCVMSDNHSDTRRPSTDRPRSLDHAPIAIAVARTRARDTHTMSAFTTRSAAFGKVSIKAKATTTTRYVYVCSAYIYMCICARDANDAWDGRRRGARGVAIHGNDRDRDRGARARGVCARAGARGARRRAVASTRGGCFVSFFARACAVAR